jgi:hypothetical protein
MLPAWACHTRPEGQAPFFYNIFRDNNKGAALPSVQACHPYHPLLMQSTLCHCRQIFPILQSPYISRTNPLLFASPPFSWRLCCQALRFHLSLWHTPILPLQNS